MKRTASLRALAVAAVTTVLGWAPKVPVDYGLARTAAWFAQEIGAAAPVGLSEAAE